MNGATPALLQVGRGLPIGRPSAPGPGPCWRPTPSKWSPWSRCWSAWRWSWPPCCT